MEQYRVKVNLLNKRTKPEENTTDKSTISGQVKENEYLDLSWAAKLSNGDWYTDGKGGFYWGGGLEEIINNINYNKLIKNIPDKWSTTLGKGITIAILDTGCIVTGSIKDAIVAKYNAISKKSDVSDIAQSNHGTFIANLIGARNNDDKIIGLAPLVKLIIIKVTDYDFGVDSDNVLEGLRWLKNSNLKPDIINISLSFSSFPHKNELFELFKFFTKENTIIYAAAQDNEGLIKNDIYYPAKENDVIGIGSLDSNSTVIKNNEITAINPKIKYIVPNYKFESIANDQIITKTGSSFATATMSGITSLAMSFIKSESLNDSSIDLINSTLTKIRIDQFENELTIYKI